MATKKWKGKVTKTLPHTPPHQIWLLYKDFFNFHNYFPSLSSCYGVDGINGVPGCIRYCAGSTLESNGGDSVQWATERLVTVDEETRSLSYDIVDTNIVGFKPYFSTVKIDPVKSDGGDEGGCVIEWSFELDEIQGLKFEDLVRNYEVALQLIADRMVASLANNSN